MSVEMIVIFPLSIVGHRTRLTKLVYIANDLRLGVSTWSWERNKGDYEKEIPFGFIKRRILLKGGGYHSRWIKLFYPFWVLSVFVSLITLRPAKPVYCLGFETAFPAWLASKFVDVKYIFDDADRFSMLVKMPRKLNRLVQKLERKVSECSVVNIIPGIERYEFTNERQVILKNMPNQGLLKESLNLKVHQREEKIVIYVNGWMGETRGLPIALKLAKRFLSRGDDVHFLAAGKVSGESAKEFIGLDNVTYMGEVSNVKALSLYRASDFVFTYYDPSIEINMYAESNKWGDAISMRVPIIVNQEVKTADFLRDRGVCISVGYDDVNALDSEIMRFVSDIEMLLKIKSDIALMESEIIYFDQGMVDILKKVYL